MYRSEEEAPFYASKASLTSGHGLLVLIYCAYKDGDSGIYLVEQLPHQYFHIFTRLGFTLWLDVYCQQSEDRVVTSKYGFHHLW